MLILQVLYSRFSHRPLTMAYEGGPLSSGQREEPLRGSSVPLPLLDPTSLQHRASEGRPVPASE